MNSGCAARSFPGCKPRRPCGDSIWTRNWFFAADAGTTEPSFPSRRTGIEWASYWTPLSGLTVDADVAISRACFTAIDSSVPGDYVLGAIEQALSVGVLYDSHAQ